MNTYHRDMCIFDKSKYLDFALNMIFNTKSYYYYYLFPYIMHISSWVVLNIVELYILILNIIILN